MWTPNRIKEEDRKDNGSSLRIAIAFLIIAMFLGFKGKLSDILSKKETPVAYEEVDPYTATGTLNVPKKEEEKPNSYNDEDGNKVTVIEEKQKETPQGGLYSDFSNIDIDRALQELYELFSDSSKFDYSSGQLSSDKKAFIREKLSSGETEFEVVTKYADSVANYVTALIEYDPQFFYYSGDVSAKLYPTKCVVELNLKYNSIKEKEEEIASVVNSIISEMPEFEDEYGKALWLYDELCKRVTYSLTDDGSDQDIYGGLVKGKCVCAGYAKSYAFLLDAAGIHNVYYHCGEAEDYNIGAVGPHAWVSAVVDDRHIYFDPTWDDNDDEITTHLFFGINKDEIDVDHFDSKENPFIPLEVKMMKSSEPFSYYKRNGCFVESFDGNTLSDVFRLQGSDMKEIMFASKDVYNEYVSSLTDIDRLYDFFALEDPTLSDFMMDYITYPDFNLLVIKKM